MNEPTLDHPWHGVQPLPGLGVIQAQGEDAAKFLHSQLTQDTALLGLTEARLAGYCSAKGRLLASFIVFKRSADQLLMVCDRSILATVLKRLSMFVLRAKVRLSDVSADWQVAGLVGNTVPSELPGQPWQMRSLGEARCVRLYPGAGQPRALWVAPAGEPLPDGAVLGQARWDWLEVAAGVAPVLAATAEAFVPQMLNHESVGGVSFKKGCYPGQEVVARSQFRGTLKRRAFLLQGPNPMAAGQAVFHSGEPEQPAGTVALAAPHPEAGHTAIASLVISATESGELHLGAPDGPVLRLLPLPYPLLAEV